LLTPITTTVPNGVDYLGGASAVYTSNIALVDDLHNYYAAYFNDDWKLAKKLTLNLGLRWEHFGLPLENHGRQANFVPGAPNNGAEYLIPDSQINRNFPLSPSVYSLFAMDGIAIKFDKIGPLVKSRILTLRRASVCLSSLAEIGGAWRVRGILADSKTRTETIRATVIPTSSTSL